MRVPVRLGGMEIECCVGVPEVGAIVSWSLAWRDEPADPAGLGIRWVSEPVQVDRREVLAVGEETGHRLSRGPLSAWWSGGGGPPLPSRGVLDVEPHGFVPSFVPDTRGRVLDQSLVLQRIRHLDGHQYRVVDLEVWPMADAGPWYDWEEYAQLGGPLGRDESRQPGGLLVTLDVLP